MLLIQHASSCGQGIIWNRTMEEEGTAVYFEASPAAEELKGKGDSHELIFVSDHHPSELHSTQEGTKKEQGNGSTWMFSTVFHKLLTSLYVQESKYVERAISDIKNSSLLTEEDYQMLYYTITEPTSHEGQTDVERRRNNWFTLISSVAIAVVACAAAVNSMGLLIIAIATIMTILAGTLKLVRVRSERCLKCGLSSLSSYSSRMETLLSLLTQILRIIQEMEIISHGYRSPSRSVPISRVERQQGGSYQCPVLRRRLFKTCQEGTVLLRKCAHLLCKDYPLNEELDCVHSYLAFTPLEELHQYLHKEMDEDTVLSQSDKAEKLPCLALDSLKDACSLLAVQNSEVLRRIALNLAFGSKNNPQTGCDKKEFKFLQLSQLLREPLQFVSGACEKLEWSLEFHRNHLFGEAPNRHSGKPPLKKHPLQPVMDEVHCMDLKTQVALQRIREFSSLLPTLTLEDDSEADVTQDSHMEPLRDHLVSIQHDIESVRDLVSDSIQLLDKLCKPHSSQGLHDLHRSPQEGYDPSDAEVSEESQESQDERSSDEEMVFEAYIPPQVDVSEMDNLLIDRLTEEERKELQELQREAREVPVKMMKELRSVLSVRSVEKQKKKEEKRRKKGYSTESVQTPEHSKQQQFRAESENLEPSGIDNDTMKQTTKVQSQPEDEVCQTGYRTVAVPGAFGPCSEMATGDDATQGINSPKVNFNGSTIEAEEGGTGSRTDYEWRQSLAPQLGSLAQAIMAAGGPVTSKGNVEEVFGDASDDD